MVWSLVINGELKQEGELQAVLESLKVGESVIAEHNGHKFRVTKRANPKSFYPVVWEIDYILPNGRETFVINALHWFDVPYRIQGFVVGDGWLKMHGKGNHPLDEFEWEFDPHIRTAIERRSDGTWVFHGNHKEFSGAFRYIIWDEKLAGEIERRLKEVSKRDS